MKRILKEISRFLRKLFPSPEPTPVPDPIPVPVPVPAPDPDPVDDQYVRKTYLIEGKVKRAKGQLRSLVVGQEAKAIGTIEGLQSDFDNPIGKKFMVQGKVQSMPLKDMFKEKDLTSNQYPYVLENMEEKDDGIDHEHLTASISYNIEPSWESIKDIRIWIEIENPLYNMLLNDIEIIGEAILEKSEEIDPPTPEPEPEPVPTPTPPEEGWEDGYKVDSLPVKNGSAEFWTRDIRKPTRPQKDGSYEYILCRMNGQGYRRILLMTMYDRPTRIFIERTGDGDYSLIQGRFSQPLPGPSHWKVAADGSRVWIELDGKEIWSEVGQYTLDHVTMAGYSGRGFLGEWRESTGVPTNDKFPDPSKPFVGYGTVDKWMELDPVKYMEAINQHNIQCMAFEFWDYEKIRDVDLRIKQFEKYVQLAKRYKKLLYVQFWNCNFGRSGGENSTNYQSEIYKAINQLALWMKDNPNLLLTPCGEGGNCAASASADRKLQEWCKSNMTREQLVNNWPSKPTSTDGMKYLCYHPSSVSAAKSAPSWIMSDHSSFIRELNGGDLKGTADYNITLNCAKSLLERNKTFIFYHGWDEVIDYTALKALRDAQK